jgi:uncharacterized membrane protein YfcA
MDAVSTGWIFAIFAASGVAAGFFAGLFGIGGGLIMVPVLVYAFTTTGIAPEHVVAMALGTSMAAIVFSAAQSAYGHYCKGSASIETIRKTAPWVIVGVVIGGIAALAGIGGGTLFTPYFKASGMEPKLAIGTSAAIGLPVSVAGALAYGWEGYGMDLCRWAIGYINVPALIALVLGTLVTVRLGVAVAHRLPSRALASAFAVFLILNGGHLLYSALASNHTAIASPAPPVRASLEAPNARAGSAQLSLAN